MGENRGTEDSHVTGPSLDETIAAVDGLGREFNAATSVIVDRARNLGRKSVDRAAAGEPARVLEGVLFAIKDVIDVAGFPTTMGSNVSTGPDPSTTAPVVSLLEKAGALSVAKANCQEFSYGIIGFKPTFGTVSTDGLFPLLPSFDTVGLFAREIGLLTWTFEVVAGVGEGGSGADDSGADTVPAVELSLLNAAEASADTAHRWAEAHFGTVRATSAKSEELGEIIERLFGIYDIVRRFEATILHQRFAEEQAERYQPGVWAKIMAGQTITEVEYREQVGALEALRASALGIFDEVDFIGNPAIEGDVLRWDQIGPESSAPFIRCAMPFNVLGWPAVTLPIGAVAEVVLGNDADGAGLVKPESVQIVGRPHRDRRLLDFVAGL